MYYNSYLKLRGRESHLAIEVVCALPALLSLDDGRAKYFDRSRQQAGQIPCIIIQYKKRARAYGLCSLHEWIQKLHTHLNFETAQNSEVLNFRGFLGAVCALKIGC